MPAPNEASLRVLDAADSSYWLPHDPVVAEVIIPGLKNASQVDIMAGYFTGSVLVEMAHGLASYLVNSAEPLRLLVSPVIPEADQRAMAAGAAPGPIAFRALEVAMNDPDAMTNLLAIHTKECLAYLLATGRLEIRVVLMREGTYHPKHWAFHRGDDVAVLSGSANLTGRAFSRNVEQLRLDRSWRGEEQRYACAKGLSKFDEYWNNLDPDTSVSVTVADAIARDLLQGYGEGRPPTEEEYLAALDAEGLELARPLVVGESFAIPKWLKWESGPFKHQGEAVRAWEENGNLGVLAIATGGGKTICSLVAAHRLAQHLGKLFIVVTAPTRPLVSQWGLEMEDFGLHPYVASSKKTAIENAAAIDVRLESVAQGITTVDSAVITNNLLNSPAMKKILNRHRNHILLIGDEAHNLGSEAFVEDPPKVKYRLGLSATPTRQYDPEGTADLFEYFGGVVYEFGLAQAIGLCLVPYSYFVHDSHLSAAEMEDYRSLSAEIRAMYARLGEDAARTSEALQIKLFRRRSILESAAGKIAILRSMLEGIDRTELRHTLIYATDKDPEQLDLVNATLRDLGIRFHQLTQDETQNPDLVRELIRRFRDGTVQVLTAKRVLDEGFNIPEISTAYVLASTTVERQWTQRRGRILRICPSTGKTHATLHDIVALPPVQEGIDDDVRALVQSELKRVDEFAHLSQNQHAADGANAWLQRASVEYRVWMK